MLVPTHYYAFGLHMECVRCQYSSLHIAYHHSDPDPAILVKYIYGSDFITQLSSGNVSVGIWGNSNWTNTPEWIKVRAK